MVADERLQLSSPKAHLFKRCVFSDFTNRPKNKTTNIALEDLLTNLAGDRRIELLTTESKSVVIPFN